MSAITTMKSIKVQINNKEVTVSKLPLGKYAEVLNALDKLPEKVSGLDKVSEDKLFSLLPKMIADSFPELLKIISIASDVPVEELSNEYGLDDVTLLLKGIFEVNDFDSVRKNIQGLLGKKPRAARKTGSKE